MQRFRKFGVQIEIWKIFPNPLVVQWLGLCAVTAEGLCSILGRGTKIPQATHGAAKKKNQKHHSKQQQGPTV